MITFKYFITIILCTIAILADAQYFPQYDQQKPRKRKQKEIPRFPPQVNRLVNRDSLENAQRITDSLAKLSKKYTPPVKPASTTTNTAKVNKPTPKPYSDTVIRVISEKTDVNGNIIKEIEIATGKKKWRQTSITGGRQLNKPFNPDTINKDSITIQIVKKNYRMYIYHKHKFLTAYKCVFGPPHMEQKVKEGDRKTPEGWFKILEIRDHKEWSKFMLIDYPNEDSYKIWAENQASGKAKAGDKIGGAIGIHGVWDGGNMAIEQKKNWTDGCIALKNEDVIELSKIVQPGTVINVRKTP